MIRLKGKDVVDEALWETENPLGSRAVFYLVRNGRKQEVSGEQVPELIEKEGVDPETFLCEIPCVWDVLQEHSEKGSVLFFVRQEVVIVQNPYYGGELGSGVRAFAVLRPVFEKAARWAKATPILSIDDALDEFMSKLFPRIILRKGGWQSNPVLLRNAGSLSLALSQLFALDLDSIRTELECSNGPLSPMMHSVLLFDLVLEKIRKSFTLSERTGHQQNSDDGFSPTPTVSGESGERTPGEWSRRVLETRGKNKQSILADGLADVSSHSTVKEPDSGYEVDPMYPTL
ncbi:MAG: hypothetical protein ACYC9S_04990 [Leptospirales bacterium]